MKVHDYEQLSVWKKSMNLVEDVYRLTKKFPKDEVYGLVNQMRRSAVSIPSNIAEGSRRGTNKDFRQFLIIALGSGSELDTQLKITRRLAYISGNEVAKTLGELSEIMRMLNGLITALKI